MRLFLSCFQSIPQNVLFFRIIFFYLGPCIMTEDIASPQLASLLYKLGPHYLGSLQAPQVQIRCFLTIVKSGKVNSQSHTLLWVFMYPIVIKFHSVKYNLADITYIKPISKKPRNIVPLFCWIDSSDLVECRSSFVSNFRRKNRFRLERRRSLANDPGQDEKDLQQGNNALACFILLYSFFSFKKC